MGYFQDQTDRHDDIERVYEWHEPPTITERPPPALRKPASRTALQIKVAIGLTLLLAALSWAAGLFAVIRGQRHLVFELGESVSKAAFEIVLLIFTACITVSSDALGYVHAASLRWALFREGRLEYNTNYRLLTSARRSRVNSWPVNLASAAALVLCYASVSALVVRDTNKYVWGETDAPAANAMALLFLGTGLAGQAAVAVACLRNVEERIPSWSPNPLWNTRTCLDGHTAVLSHRPGRCMMSVAERNEPARLAMPSSNRQPRLWSMRATRWIVSFLWGLFVASMVWAVVVVYVPTTMTDDNPFRFRWDDDPRDEFRNVIFGMSPIVNNQSDVTFPPGLQFFLGILFLCAIQGLQAIGLHCVELLVNMSRDEAVWRRAASSSGVSPSSSPLVAAMSSWQTLLLTVLKTAVHWVLGQCMILHYSIDYESFDYTEFTVNMSGSRLLIFACLVGLTAVFATAMAVWPVRGAQPAAWGHLQTLADLVDDWDAPEDRLWWGDKGEAVGGVRHAGTVGRPHSVNAVVPNCLYAGADAWS